ncbi:MAG TPA: EAL domain-containing protein, partial [Actinomycetota bacterium]|nr:EAL domain-containing protein [Actinomycetota bacterium]
LEKLLRAAVSRGDLHMAFQPVFSMSGGALLGFEALLRWTDRDGPIPPSEFIPLAEDSGLIQRIGAIALDIGVSFAAELGRQPMGESLTVSVNISGLQVTHGDLAAQVAEALERHHVPGSRLILELTETALLSDPKAVAARMQAIADQGVELALDDFGTGFSSLTSLREFPLAALKVDRMFTRNVDSSERDRAIVAAVVALGHALGLSVVAEGVETAHHLHTLTEMGCDAGQGFYFGRPLVWESALALAAAWGAPTNG